MKIWLSRPSERTGKRKLVLDMTQEEEHAAFSVLREHVIGYRGRAPERQRRRDGTVRYRFARSHLQRLYATFPYADLSPGLERRLRRAAEKEMEDTPVPDIDIPDFMADSENELYDYQKIGVARIEEGLDEQGWFFLNDDLGLGKTAQAMAVMVKRMLTPALIICPNNAKVTPWARKFQEWTALDDVVVVDAWEQNAAERAELIAERHEVTIVNIEACRNPEPFEGYEYKFLVTDEHHRFKNPNAQQTQGWQKIEAEFELEMSGTPILNRAEESWSALHRVDPNRWPDYWSFERWLCIKSKPQKYYEIERDERGRIVRDERGRPKKKLRKIPAKVVGYKPDRFATLRAYIQDPKHSLRRRKEQVLDDLPEVTTTQLLIDLTPEQRRLYNQIKREMKLALRNGEIRDIRGVLAQYTRAKQACFSPELYDGTPHSAKLDELKLVVDQAVSAGHKMLIGAEWSKACRIIERELIEYNPAYVDGKVRGPKRIEQQDKFNDDEDCWLYIGTIAANQEAITLDCDYVSIISKPWSPKALEQFVGRSAAGGLRGVGVEHVNIVEYFARDTIEERIDALLETKRRTFNALIEKDGGAPRQRSAVTEIADLF